MNGPKRIQVLHAEESTAPDGAVYVGQRTKWANSFAVGEAITDPLFEGVPSLLRGGRVEDAEHSVALWGFWVMAKVPFTVTDVRRELAGKDIGCSCSPEELCHGDVLLEIANGGDRP